MRSLALMLARLCATAWVGAAALFVVVGVLEVTAPNFTSETKDQLAVLRFPAYYLCGAVLIGVALLSSAAAIGHGQLPRWRGWVATGLLAAALATLGADYILVYKPLERLITPPGKPRTSEFIALHRWSSRVNSVQVGLCAVSAVLLCAPSRRPRDAGG